MVQGQVFIKGQLALLLFNCFKVYHFYILKLFYSLQNCVTHLKLHYFFYQHNFMKKVVLKLSKNEPVSTFKEIWCVGLGQEEGPLCEGGGNCLKYFKRG